jgi:hypothetical protein
MAGTWKTFNTPKIGSANLVADTMLLLTDGSVLIHQLLDSYRGVDGRVWMRLTPNSAGDYANGHWTGPFWMYNQREDFASGITADGRVYVVGGEYSDDFDNPNTQWVPSSEDSPLGEIFDPAAEAWSPLNKPANLDYIRGDIASCGLADGRVLFGSLASAETVIWDPAKDKDAWTVAGTAYGTRPVTKDSVTNEETWTLLPDGCVLTVEVAPSPNNQTLYPSERYAPGSDRWVPAGSTIQPLVVGTVYCTYAPSGNPPQPQAVNVSEIGPAVLLPDGTLFAIGATGYTAIYTPGTHSWTPGPSFPADTTNGTYTDDFGNRCDWILTSRRQGSADAPAVLLPGGQVLCCAGDLQPSWDVDNNQKKFIELNGQRQVGSFFNFPTNFYLYDPAQKALLPVSRPIDPKTQKDMSQDWTWKARLLLLPNGQVLYSSNGATLGLYQPSDDERKPAATVTPPTIANFGSADFPATLTLGKSYTIVGNYLNGFSQANSYGDDAQMATNFPLVRITNTVSKEVAYLRTFNFSSLGVAVQGPVSCQVDVSGNGLTAGTYTLVVVANAVPSLPVTVQIAKPTS